ncbi:hypothetical protein IX321_000370 [Bacteroides pyogenes]|nr:hypothetical protein [Bacteroides pyogenes]MBR8716685.1 hypothetical protein [Bacteroides pyogenes]MBR8745967.1 hypothetical protein [Bacteroides pyogenes]MBR8756243.1 hypothetical protein [Bacteroides pyogenes]MBR8779470.1 hypothetical protein [Bacteroides pyogenes]
MLKKHEKQVNSLQASHAPAKLHRRTFFCRRLTTGKTEVPIKENGAATCEKQRLCCVEKKAFSSAGKGAKMRNSKWNTFSAS